MAEPIIVGVDPGNTSAVAAVNLDGEKVLLESRRELSPPEIIQLIIDTGKPVLVACDTGKMPSTVEKVASSLGAAKYEPSEDLDSARKEKLGEGDNSHEKDAMAAAMHAYKDTRTGIRKIREISSETGKELAEVADTYFSENLMRLKQES